VTRTPDLPAEYSYDVIPSDPHMPEMTRQPDLLQAIEGVAARGV